MFPDLTSDDIFRIETKRLWVRWPRAADAAAITSFASLAHVARMTASLPHPYPAGEAERFILRARADNACGAALILVTAPKPAAQQAVGILSALPAASGDIEIGYLLSPAVWGRGLASEAVAAMVDAVFTLTPVKQLIANSRVDNAASRRVLEKSGFSFVDSGLDYLPARGGRHACDRFRIDRHNWTAQRRRAGPDRALPPMAQQDTDHGSGMARVAGMQRAGR